MYTCIVIIGIISICFGSMGMQFKNSWGIKFVHIKIRDLIDFFLYFLVEEIEGEVADIMKEVVPILFPEKFTVKEDLVNSICLYFF